MNPADGYNDKAHVLRMAARAKARGMRLFIDFHYSDAWADPGKQNKPAAWAGYAFEELKAAVRDHTYDVLHALHRQGTPADLVQIGNEINGGLLWPDGRWDNWPNLAALLTAGASVAKAVSNRTRVVLHLAEGGNNGGHRWWFDNATSLGVPFDVIAVSHYLYWHGTAESLRANIVDLSARYGKDVLVAETAYGFTTAEDDPTPQIFTADLAAAGGHPATPRGQADAVRAVCDVVASVPAARARRRLLGADLDRRDRRRLGPRGSDLRQRLGEPGAVRLRRPGAAGVGRVPRLLSRRSYPARGGVSTPGTPARRAVRPPSRSGSHGPAAPRPPPAPRRPSRRGCRPAVEPVMEDQDRAGTGLGDGPAPTTRTFRLSRHRRYPSPRTCADCHPEPMPSGRPIS